MDRHRRHSQQPHRSSLVCTTTIKFVWQPNKLRKLELINIWKMMIWAQMTHHVERRAWPEDDDPEGDGRETMRVLGFWGLGKRKGNAPRKWETTSEQSDSKRIVGRVLRQAPSSSIHFVSFIHPCTKSSQCKMRYFNWGLSSRSYFDFASIIIKKKC